jgi:hypothetical protein
MPHPSTAIHHTRYIVGLLLLLLLFEIANRSVFLFFLNLTAVAESFTSFSFFLRI